MLSHAKTSADQNYNLGQTGFHKYKTTAAAAAEVKWLTAAAGAAAAQLCSALKNKRGELYEYNYCMCKIIM